MPKNICILTTNEDDFFTPPVLDYLSINLINELSCIVFVSGFASIKRKLFTIFQLKFTEIIEILMQRFIFFFKKREYKFKEIKTKLIKNVNSEESIEFFKKNNFDLIVTINCNQIIKKNTLNKIPSDFVNFHPGKLPNYRGIFTCYYSLLNKEKEICLSFHKINARIDSGPLMKELVYLIEKKETVFSLYKKLYLNKKSYNFIIDCIKNYELYKKNIINKPDNIIYPYYSYPKIKQVIYFFIRLNLFGRI